VKKLYFFRPNLKNHFYLYYSWIQAASKADVDVTMFTVMSKKQKNMQLNSYHEVINLKGVKVLITPHHYFNSFYTFFYLLLNVLKYGKVSLIAKKVNLSPLDMIKKIVGKRFKYAIEIEGDAVSENEYLKKHPYKKGFYDNYLLAAANNIENIPKKINRADAVLVLSHAFKKVLLQRHLSLKPEKIKVISTGFIKGRFSYNSAKRNEYRDLLGIGNEPVFIYAGNLYYSWQNIKKTLALFLHYLTHIDNTAKFIILTHQSDQYIAREFIEYLGIPSESLILKEVPNSEICMYYNVADICLLLRGDDLMNQVASPGKIGEYAASGTPILTSSHIGDYSSLFEGQSLVKQVNDITDFVEMSVKIQELLKVTEKDKIALSHWSNEKLSSENNVASFIEAFNI
jgi:hypothetical protein